MAAKKSFFYGIVMFLIAICRIKSDVVETQDEVKGEEQYVPRPDNDAISK